MERDYKLALVYIPVKPETLNIPEKVSLDEKELTLATELIRLFLGKFSIDSYHDEFRDSLMELIEAKIAAKRIKVAPKREAEKVINLMDTLKKSIGKGIKKKAV